MTYEQSTSFLVRHSCTHLKIVAINSDWIFSSSSTVDIAEYRIASGFFQGTAKNPSIFHVGQTNLTISFVSKIEEIEILSDDRSCRSRKIQRKRVFNRTKVVKLENQLFGKIVFISPDRPSDADIGQAKLMAAEKIVKHRPTIYL